MGRLSRLDRIAVGILEWGATSLRDLPWRRTSDPWHVLVSEVMLQQTSVARVLPKYDVFIAEFPNPAALADAPLGDALRLWQGLGYPRRCRNLRAAAAAIVTTHGGEIPVSLEDLLALPGIGQYTARAVQAFAHRIDAAVVDTNVSRVLSRLEGAPMGARELQRFADSLVPRGMAWEWNQSLMDFGARHCTVRQPECGRCPVRRQCRWKSEGPDPAPASAGASRPQARFEGSSRQMRGNIIRALSEGSRSRSALVRDLSDGDDRLRVDQLVSALIAEGLVVERAGRLSLP